MRARDIIDGAAGGENPKRTFRALPKLSPWQLAVQQSGLPEKELAEEIMIFYDLDDARWDSLSDEQKLELYNDEPPGTFGRP